MGKTLHSTMLSCPPNKQRPWCFIKLLLMFGFLASLLPLSASEPGEILGPESGYHRFDWISDDKVVAIKKVYEFLPDKLNYDYGEIIKVKYDISVDKSSRGYLPNRTYYLVSPYIAGHQIKGGASYYWRIMKSEIDTLEVITDDEPLKGEFTLQLVHYKDKPQKRQLGDGSFMYSTPIDTTKVRTTEHGCPPYLSIICLSCSRITNRKKCSSARIG